MISGSGGVAARSWQTQAGAAPLPFFRSSSTEESTRRGARMCGLDAIGLVPTRGSRGNTSPSSEESNSFGKGKAGRDDAG